MNTATNSDLNYYLFHATKDSIAEGKFLSTTMKYLGSIVANNIAEAYIKAKPLFKLKNGDVILKENNFYQITKIGSSKVNTFELICSLPDE